MKPLAIYKLSKVEAALRRLDGAIANLETVAISGAANGPVVAMEADAVDGEMPVVDAPLIDAPLIDESEVIELRKRCDDLSSSLRAASIGVDVTISRLKLLLDS